MAVEKDGMLIQNTSFSLRNARIMDRTKLRGYTMEQQEDAFAVYHGGADLYKSGNVMVEPDSGFDIKISKDQWENGNLTLSQSGTITVIPDDEIKNYVF